MTTTDTDIRFVPFCTIPMGSTFRIIDSEGRPTIRCLKIGNHNEGPQPVVMVNPPFGAFRINAVALERMWTSNDEAHNLEVGQVFQCEATDAVILIETPPAA